MAGYITLVCIFMIGDQITIDKEVTMLYVHKWNEIIYKDANGAFVEGERLDTEALWNDYKIKSWPKFKDACSYCIPIKWVSEIRILIEAIQTELGDKFKFSQIKEKWCNLTIYFDRTDDKSTDIAEKLIAKCKNNLIAQGIHPSADDMKVGNNDGE